MKVLEQTRAESSVTSKAMSIANNSVVFDLLVNRLYSDKPMAVLREYLCNAYDAHVEAGTTDVTIKVHLPTILEPFFSCRDFGTGMSADTVSSVFSTLGESTKRDSNEVTGMLGIGSKSALTASESFLVTSFYQGFKSIYSIFLDNGMPTISHFGTMPTDEANGLEIHVAVPQEWVRSMKVAADKFLPHFQGKLLVNQMVSLDLGTPLYEGTDWKLYDNSNYAVIVMGNIPYPVSNTASNLRDIKGLVVTLPIGDVQFAASREALSYTPGTINTLKALHERILSELTAQATAGVEEHKGNLIKQATMLQALPYNVRYSLLVDSKHLTKREFNIRGGYFKFGDWNSRTNRWEYLQTLRPNQYGLQFVMADNLVQAKEVAKHIEARAILITYAELMSHFGGKKEAEAQLKAFCDILGAPFVLASEQYHQIFGGVAKKTVVARAPKSTEYVAEGFTCINGKITTGSITVSNKTASYTIGIPLHRGCIMTADYASIVYSRYLSDDLKHLMGIVKPAIMQVVYVEKNRRSHLKNTITAHDWVKGLRLPEVTVCDETTTKKYADTPDLMYLSGLDLPVNYIKYLEEVHELTSAGRKTRIVAGRFDLPITLNVVTESKWLAKAHVRFDLLNVTRVTNSSNKTDVARFEKLAHLLDKQK